MEKLISNTRKSIRRFLKAQCTGHFHYPLDGQFCLYRGSKSADMYGMVDAVYLLYALGELQEFTSRESRKVWASRILACQDEEGWFTKGNKRGHSKEHASAYAIGALRLLDAEGDQEYVAQVRPINALLPVLTDQRHMEKWLCELDFRWTPERILKKNLGWHYIWRGSHVGGGVGAIIGMLDGVLNRWWHAKIDVEKWFDWYFDWLDRHVNPQTGYWQRAFWNLAWKRPTVNDMGGAVHFYWLYQARGRPFPYPAALIESTLGLQKPNGLYKKRPFCIDLDGNFCLTRAYAQLPKAMQNRWRGSVEAAVNKSGLSILHFLAQENLLDAYPDSHGPPGAIIGLIECAKLENSVWENLLQGWQHPLDKVTWL